MQRNNLVTQTTLTPISNWEAEKIGWICEKLYCLTCIEMEMMYSSSSSMELCLPHLMCYAEEMTFSFRCAALCASFVSFSENNFFLWIAYTQKKIHFIEMDPPIRFAVKTRRISFFKPTIGVEFLMRMQNFDGQIARKSDFGVLLRFQIIFWFCLNQS